MSDKTRVPDNNAIQFRQMYKKPLFLLFMVLHNKLAFILLPDSLSVVCTATAARPRSVVADWPCNTYHRLGLCRTFCRWCDDVFQVYDNSQ